MSRERAARDLSRTGDFKRSNLKYRVSRDTIGREICTTRVNWLKFAAIDSNGRSRFSDNSGRFTPINASGSLFGS